MVSLLSLAFLKLLPDGGEVSGTARKRKNSDRKCHEELEVN